MTTWHTAAGYCLNHGEARALRKLARERQWLGGTIRGKREWLKGSGKFFVLVSLGLAERSGRIFRITPRGDRVAADLPPLEQGDLFA